jgi:hypothetical protein
MNRKTRLFLGGFCCVFSLPTGAIAPQRAGKGRMRAGGGVNAEKRKISAKRFTGFARNSSFSAEREERRSPHEPKANNHIFP